jgi:hypothetical protein
VISSSIYRRKRPTLQRQNAENLKQISPEKEYINGIVVAVKVRACCWKNSKISISGLLHIS